MPWIDRGVKSILDEVFPEHCLVCARPGEHGVCDRCAADFPRPSHQCRRCAAAIPRPGICGVCQQRPPAFDRVLAPYSYAAPVSGFIQALKYGRREVLAPPLGNRMCREIAPRMPHRPDLILPIPLHWSRLLGRGFNQAIELAKPLSRALDIPLDRNSVVRHIRTQPQTRLPLKLRRRNVAGAFRMRRVPPAASVALVDDVMTSGETAGAVAKLLKQGGVQHVQVWVLARV